MPCRVTAKRRHKKWKNGLCLRSAPLCRLNRKTHSQHFKRCLQTGKSPYFNSYHNSLRPYKRKPKATLTAYKKSHTLMCWIAQSSECGFSISNCLHRCFLVMIYARLSFIMLRKEVKSSSPLALSTPSLMAISRTPRWRRISIIWPTFR